MLVYLPDIVFLLIAGAVTYFVAQRMMVESALIFLAILISSLGAIILFEPVAGWCRDHLFLRTDISTIRFLGAFWAIFIFAILAAVLLQSFLLTVVEPPVFGSRVEAAGSWGFGALTGYVLAAFLLTIVHTLPAPRNYWGIFAPEATLRPGPVMAMAPDYQFLSFVDYVCVPHDPVSGVPWKPGGPAISAEFDKGRWASFPLRYALWREDLAMLRGETEDDGSGYDSYDGLDEQPNAGMTPGDELPSEDNEGNAADDNTTDDEE